MGSFPTRSYAFMRLTCLVVLNALCFISMASAQTRSGLSYRDAGVEPIAGVPQPQTAPVRPDPRRPEIVDFRVLHTNDLHCQYRPEKGPFGLGGIARLATAIRRARAEVAQSILVDGGDWSEGKIYFQLDGGRTALEMLNELGYDAAVVGNHDWLNGPGGLLTILKRTPPRFALLSSNLALENPAMVLDPSTQRIYDDARELLRNIAPYTIVSSGPLRIGIIGVSTFEIIYDRYFRPIKPQIPFATVRRLAKHLKEREGVDLVVLASHNSLELDRVLAGFPNVDVVVHAHDHLKLAEPVIVPKGRSPEEIRDQITRQPFGVVIEAEKWGRYLGCLDLRFNTRSGTFTIQRYQLIQIDQSIDPDLHIQSKVSEYEAELIDRYRRQGEGNIFEDSATVGGTNVFLSAEGGKESLFGNLLADAYREFSGADIAFEQANFTSGNLAVGPITTSDVINSLGQIFNPLTGKTWTLSIMGMRGDVLTAIMKSLFNLEPIIPGGLPSVSGMHIVYDPRAQDMSPFSMFEIFQRANTVSRVIQRIEVGGRPLDPQRLYRVAIPEGIKDSLGFLSGIGLRFARESEVDTGVEDWRILREYLRRHSVIQAQNIANINRYQTVGPDLAIHPHDIEVNRTPQGLVISATVHNYGSARSQAQQLWVGYDRTPTNTVDDPNLEVAPQLSVVPPIEPDGSVTIRVSIGNVPITVLSSPVLPVAAEIITPQNSSTGRVGVLSLSGGAEDLNTRNNKAVLVSRQ